MDNHGFTILIILFFCPRRNTMINISIIGTNKGFADRKHIHETKNTLAPMGVLAPGSAHDKPSSLPPLTPAEIRSVHMSAKSPSNFTPNATKPQKNVIHRKINAFHRKNKRYGREVSDKH
jgi:hypothetical protein